MARTRNNVLAAFLLIFTFAVQVCQAQEDKIDLDLLKQEISNSDTIVEAEPRLKKLSQICIGEDKFDELYDFLAILEKDKIFNSSPLIYYYAVSTRIKQIQFLEENKIWEQLFNNKDLYETQMEKDLEKAKKLSTGADEMSLRLKFLEWKLAKDDKNVYINTLEELFNLARDYSVASGNAQAIKEIADELSKDNEMNYAKKLYSVYISKLAQTDIGLQELKDMAEGFLKEGKVDLSISLFDVYLDKLSAGGQEDVAVSELFKVAEMFAHSGWQEGLDPFYAEKIYEELESLYGEKVFSAASQYNRAYNLERSKEFEPCIKEYLKLTSSYPDYQEMDRIYFHLGVIVAYISKETKMAKEYFMKVVKDYPESVDYLNSLYHLGLLSQFEGDLEKAKNYYSWIQEDAKDLEVKPEIVQMAESRLKEVNEGKDMDYNLRVFLDTVFKQEDERKYVHLDLFAKEAKKFLKETVKYEANSYYLETGCLQREFTYLWSGQLGHNQNPFNQYNFETSYEETGTKVVNVALVGPTGAIDGTIEIADIYSK